MNKKLKEQNQGNCYKNVATEMAALDTIQRLMKYNIHKIGCVMVAPANSEVSAISQYIYLQHASKHFTLLYCYYCLMHRGHTTHITIQQKRAKSRQNLVNAEKHGYLKKKGESAKTPWRVRWFVLKDGFLYYFKTPQVRVSLQLLSE